MKRVSFALYIASIIIFSSQNAISRDLEDPNRLGDLGIINGKRTPIGDMPFMAALECYGVFVNGAIIISETAVLTFMGNHPETNSCQLRTGSQYRLRGGSVYSLDYSICYFEAQNFDELICIDTVTSQIEFDDNTKMIEIGDKGLQPGDTVTIGGWGVTNATGPPSDMLRSKTATIVDMKTCASAAGLSSDLALMCTKNGTTSFGDYGGPVIHNNKAVGMVIQTFPDIDAPYDFYINLTHPKIKDFITSWLNLKKQKLTVV